ncbi:MAG: GGDEF domain-containing phosphodiesterase [Eubacteriales bacterium]|nr:GGDEF domain-containing phosphodiesterase [Eubacteriales bacterium]
MDNNKDTHLECPMMTEEGSEELYMYSLKKMAYDKADSEKIKLTNLFGLKAFFFRGNELLRHNPAQKFAVIEMNIYRFKTVNEFCGRAEGDKLLKFIADCFRSYESETCIAAHFRADIFAMCMPYKDADEIISVIDSIYKKLVEYKLPCRILPAFGVCMSEPGMDISLMCDYAAMAIDNIKGKVFSYYSFYENNMRDKMLYEKKIENEVGDAIKNGYIKVYVQPKVDMRTRKIIGGEALVRWIHPVEGMIYPDVFIPVFEKSGYIVDVDCFVWEQVFKHLQKWLDDGKQIVPVSLNVSRLHVHQENFTDFIMELAQKYRINPEMVPLEVTESALVEDTEVLYQNISYLQKQNFKFSMDDFGSGYSSLNMLKDEHVDEIKIDKAFIDDIDSEKSRIVVRNVINMIEELGIKLIAEGVETQKQADFLIKNGCFNAQGYYYYKPMPIEEFGELLL